MNFTWNFIILFQNIFIFQIDSWISVEFNPPSELRLWRTGMLILTKSNGHKSNVPYQWIHRQLFYRWKFIFRCPYKAFVSRISLWNTLYIFAIKTLEINKQHNYWYILSTGCLWHFLRYSHMDAHFLRKLCGIQCRIDPLHPHALLNHKHNIICYGLNAGCSLASEDNAQWSGM